MVPIEFLRTTPVHEGINRTMNMYVDEKSDSVIVLMKRSNFEAHTDEEAPMSPEETPALS